MAPPKQKATASYELIETGGGEGYGSVEPASADANEEYDKYDGGEPLLRTVSLPAPRPAVQDDNDLIYRPAPAAVEQVVELHEEE